MAKAHGLKSPQPIMGGTLESGNKYYLSNSIEGAIWEIVMPTPGGHYNGDGQAGTWIAEDCAGASDVDFRLILGLENAVDKLLQW
jgi:hypothetical protein